MDVAERDKVNIIDGIGNCEDKMVDKLPFKKSNRAIDYLTIKTRLAFMQLRKAFIKALIFWYFDMKYHIQIKTNMSGYAIGGVLS